MISCVCIQSVSQYLHRNKFDGPGLSISLFNYCSMNNGICRVCFWYVLGYVVLYPIGTVRLETTESIISGGLLYIVCSSIPSLVSWYQTLLDMNEYHLRMSDMEYKVELLQERVAALERPRQTLVSLNNICRCRRSSQRRYPRDYKIYFCCYQT